MHTFTLHFFFPFPSCILSSSAADFDNMTRWPLVFVLLFSPLDIISYTAVNDLVSDLEHVFVCISLL